MTDPRIFPAEVSYFVGKCQSCRHSEQGSMTLLLFCKASGIAEPTKPHWQCGRYEYEPGSLG